MVLNALLLAAEQYDGSMTLICGYSDCAREGKAFQMPDWIYGLVTEGVAAEIASKLRCSAGTEPHALTVRGRMIRLVRFRKKVCDDCPLPTTGFPLHGLLHHGPGRRHLQVLRADVC